jgi:uncharacterized RDD family membrane protein YckC
MSALERRATASEAQLNAIHRLRGQAATQLDSTTSAGSYAGLVTRTLAFSIDALIIDVLAALLAVIVGLGVSLLHLPHEVDVIIAAVGGAAFIVWIVGYFVFFWSSTGQTPGSRVMRIRVIGGRATGPLKPRRALLRMIGLFLAALPLLAGFLIMLWDDRRRCLQDRIARTVVVYT